MPYTTVDGDVRLHYRECGSGPVLVFHPGFSGTLDSWNWLVRELAPSYRCVTFDPRGHGDSSKPDSSYTLDELSRDVIGLIGNLELRDVTLVGHSMGGAVSLNAVLDHNAEHRITRLVLIAPAAPCFVRPEGEDAGTPLDAFTELQAGLERDWVSTVLGVGDVFYHQTDGATARWLSELSMKMPVYLGTRLFSQLRDIDFRDRLVEVALPVLVLWGAHDKLADPRWAEWIEKRGMPTWTVQILEHSGHGAALDEPAAIAKVMGGFISDDAKRP
ncbi:alpha/beta fold hydrolase [Mycobacterium colombiense]|uniref:alpha/beta fold hydrolase n=1 Tax=Mycobacterium colombiense TaxID=339268 RepID=UPI00200A890C|nr:alpha/beta hydrolase [Mycobacterium colombiense]MCK8646709.1 alpha/beta hydrolase [Mycobacterium colombiense]